MKFRNYLLTILSLTLATTVTAGSMFVTLRAAVQKEIAIAGIPVAARVAGGLPNADGDLSIDETLQFASKFIPPLPSEEVLHDRSQQIVLDSERSFNGRLSSFVNSSSVPASGYKVKVLQNGVAVGVSTTNEDGQFSFQNLQPGVAGILAYSENGLMLFGVQLIASDPGQGQVAEVQFSIDSSVVAAADVRLARELIFSGLASEGTRFSGAVSADDDKFPYGTGERGTTLQNQSLPLNPDGSFQGAVSVMDDRTGRLREVLDLSIYCLKNGKIAGSAEVNRNGSFLVSGLTPGVYSIVGIGLDGAFASGVELISAQSGSVADIYSGNAIPVSKRAAPGFGGGVVGPSNFNSGNAEGLTDGTMGGGTSSSSPPGPETPPPTGTGAGGGTGGGTGGGAGGGTAGGGGGLGALMGGLAGGALGYALGQNDDDDPASPGI